MTVSYQRACAWTGPFCASLWLLRRPITASDSRTDSVAAPIESPSMVGVTL